MITGSLIFFTGILVGALPLIAICVRAMRDDAWDSSNVFNVLRVLGHLATHPSDFAHMWYVYQGTPSHRPFKYISRDEFSGNMRTRP